MIPNMDHPAVAGDSAALLAAVATLPPAALSGLSAAFRLHRHRLNTVLSSPELFSGTLHRLYSLSLHRKSLLIANYLLSTLQLVAPFFCRPPRVAEAGGIRLRDLDAVLLLLLFCEVRQYDPDVLDTTPSDQWHRVLVDYHCDSILSLSGVKVSPNEAVRTLVDVVAKCRSFVGSAAGCTAAAAKKVAASAAAVVALPSVEIKGCGGGGEAVECAICKEVMGEGRDVCELPCQHLFHWACVLRWLRTRNTCPCCRHRLPSDDMFEEIQRLWEVVTRAGTCG